MAQFKDSQFFGDSFGLPHLLLIKPGCTRKDILNCIEGLLATYLMRINQENQKLP